MENTFVFEKHTYFEMQQVCFTDSYELENILLNCWKWACAPKKFICHFGSCYLKSQVLRVAERGHPGITQNQFHTCLTKQLSCMHHVCTWKYSLSAPSNGSQKCRKPRISDHHAFVSRALRQSPFSPGVITMI